jgi:hypothetical protein
MQIRIAGEDLGHHEVVRRIAARRLHSAIDWLDTVEIAWTFEKLTDAPKRVREQRRGFGQVFGHFGGEPGKPDAHLVRYQLALWADSSWEFDAAIIARDTDRHRNDTGARQALDAQPPQRPVALAYATPEIEAWVIAGFALADDRERAAHAACHKRLGFDPQVEPHRLTSTHGGDRDAKRVCAELIPERETRYDRCLEAPEELWAARTKRAGGPEFLDDLTQRVVPELRRPAK